MNLYAQKWERARPVVGIITLIHGIGEYAGRYAHFADFFTENGYHIYAFDLRGHGKSEGKRGHVVSYRAFMDDIEDFTALQDKAYPDVPHFLYGHSMGGNLVINYLLRKKPTLSGIIASSPALKTYKAPPAWKIAFAKLLRAVAPALTLSNAIEGAAITRSKEQKKQYKKDPLIHNRVSIELGLSLLEQGLWAMDHANEVALPLLLQHGTADRITSVDASIDFMERVNPKFGTLRLLDGMYHELHNEPEQLIVFQGVIDWMEKCLSITMK